MALAARKINLSQIQRQQQQQLLERKQQRKANLQRAIQKIKAFMVLFFLAAIAGSLVANMVVVCEANSEVASLQKELYALQEEGKHLRLEVAKLSSSAVIEEKALELGMQYPAQSQKFILTRH